MDVSQITTIVLSVLTTVSGVVFAAKKFGAERQVTSHDQLQEDLAALRAEFSAYRRYADMEFSYHRSVNAHLENEVSELREAWPPGSQPLPPRKPYPTRPNNGG